mgnify:CR=1 FL=1
MAKKIDRIGEKNINTFGSEMVIVEYRKYSEVLQAYQNVRVTRWSDENLIKK